MLLTYIAHGVEAGVARAFLKQRFDHYKNDRHLSLEEMAWSMGFDSPYVAGAPEAPKKGAPDLRVISSSEP